MDEYKFWKTQPVRSFDEDKVEQEGPIDSEKTVDDVPKEPRKLLDAFEWTQIDIDDKAQLEEFYDLLYNNYIEDDDETFRFQYSPQFLEWALKIPGYRKKWTLGVRAKATNKLVASITAVPQSVRVRDHEPMEIAEVNFLCVHKKLRSKRLAPVLIQEVTRQVNLTGIWQALYTAGIILPSPISTARYYHRPLDWNELYAVGFSSLSPGATPAQMNAKFALPLEPTLKDLRPMTEKDVTQVHELLNGYLSRFDLSPEFVSDEEVSHYFLGTKNPLFQVEDDEKPIYSYVVSEGDKVTDFISFYVIPSTVLGVPGHDKLKVAYGYYYASSVHESVPKTGKTAENQKALAVRLKTLQQNALILAKNIGCHVYNALTIQDNPLYLDDLKFAEGTGVLNYYLFNYRAYPVHGGIQRDGGLGRIEVPSKGGVGTILL